MKNKPLLYYRTLDEMKEYKRKPVKEKLQWLEAQMEFYHSAMSRKAKKIRERLKAGKL